MKKLKKKRVFYLIRGVTNAGKINEKWKLKCNRNIV